MTTSIVGTCLTASLLSGWCAIVGGTLLRALLPGQNILKATRSGLGFFLGASALLGGLRLLTACGVSFHIAAGWMLVLSVGSHILYRGLPKLELASRWRLSDLLVLSLLMLLVVIVSGSFWIYEDGYSIASAPQASCGSIESGRYANIATYIRNFDRIPVLGQNYGQSILAALLPLAGFTAPVFTLWLWLSISLFWLMVALFGVVEGLRNSRSVAATTTVIVLCCGSPLSFLHLVVVDSVTPFLLNGYTDTFLAIGSLFVCLFCVISKHWTGTILGWYALWLCLVPAWCLIGPQNIVVAPVLVTGLIALRSYSGTIADWRVGLRQLFFSATGFLIILILFLCQGGMLTPKILQDNVNIPGVLSSSDAGGPKIASGLYHLRLEQNASAPAFTAIPPPPFPTHDSGGSKLQFVLVRLSEALRLLFYPFVGVLVALGSFWGIKNIVSREWAMVTILTAVVGFTVSFGVALGDYKWQLSRFMVPGMVLGLMVFGIALTRMCIHRYALIRFAAIAVILMCIFGPIKSLYFRVRYNLPHIPQRIEQMSAIHGVVGR